MHIHVMTFTFVHSSNSEPLSGHCTPDSVNRTSSGRFGLLLCLHRECCMNLCCFLFAGHRMVRTKYLNLNETKNSIWTVFSRPFPVLRYIAHLNEFQSPITNICCSFVPKTLTLAPNYLILMRISIKFAKLYAFLISQPPATAVPILFTVQHIQFHFLI